MDSAISRSDAAVALACSFRAARASSASLSVSVLVRRGDMAASFLWELVRDVGGLKAAVSAEVRADRVGLPSDSDIAEW